MCWAMCALFLTFKGTHIYVNKCCTYLVREFCQNRANQTIGNFQSRVCVLKIQENSLYYMTSYFQWVSVQSRICHLRMKCMIPFHWYIYFGNQSIANLKIKHTNFWASETGSAHTCACIVTEFYAWHFWFTCVYKVLWYYYDVSIRKYVYLIQFFQHHKNSYKSQRNSTRWL